MTSPKFITGSIFKHIIVMTASSTAGLIAMFAVELVDMYFLSLLGQTELAAAIGYAGSILFLTVSFAIGLMIATSVMVSRTIGSGDRELAKEQVAHSALTSFLVSAGVFAVALPLMPWALDALGAKGVTFELAKSYLYIVLPSMLVMMVALSAGGVLRALGDAKGGMWLTLSGAIVNLILDPILIFGFEMGIEGAAWATSISRVAMLLYVIYKIGYVHKIIVKPNFPALPAFWSNFFKVGFPAILTNLATPIALLTVTWFMAQFGDSAVAGNAVIGRLQPVAFAALFALSGALGPIAGQNLGAKLFDRVEQTLNQGMKFVLYYTLIACFILFAAKELIVSAFGLNDGQGGDAEALLRLFLNGLSLMFIANGITFVTSALFNNLGKPQWATYFNLGKATFGTFPFIWVGGYYYGPEGVLIGMMIGAFIFAGLAWWTCHRLIKNLSVSSQ
jgi:putative MATE family efflux protein